MVESKPAPTLVSRLAPWIRIGITAAVLGFLATKVKADATPDIPSFRSKMGPVLDGFIAKAGPKAKAYIEATQKAA